MKKKEPTLFKVRPLKDTFGNYAEDILKVKLVDTQGNIYYYDVFNRWCFLLAEEEGKVWERWKRK